MTDFSMSIFPLPFSTVSDPTQTVQDILVDETQLNEGGEFSGMVIDGASVAAMQANVDGKKSFVSVCLIKGVISNFANSDNGAGCTYIECGEHAINLKLLGNYVSMINLPNAQLKESPTDKIISQAPCHAKKEEIK